MDNKLIFVTKTLHRFAEWFATSDQFQRTVVCIHRPKTLANQLVS